MTDVKAELDALMEEWRTANMGYEDLAHRAASIGARGEREECAKLAERLAGGTSVVSRAILARSQDPESRPCKHGCIDHSVKPSRCDDCGEVVEFVDTPNPLDKPITVGISWRDVFNRAATLAVQGRSTAALQTGYTFVCLRDAIDALESEPRAIQKERT